MPSEAQLSFLSDEVKVQIKTMVCELLEVEENEVLDTSSFVDEFEMDSLLAIELVAALEKRMDLKIDQEDMRRMVNLEGVYEVVREAVGRR
jgi:acyl carrier protein